MSAREPIWSEDDDYCQHQLLPMAAWAWCERELRVETAFEQEHRIDLGEGMVGYSGMRVRGQPPAEIGSLRLRVSALRQLMMRFGLHEHPVSSEEILTRTAAFRGKQRDGEFRDVVFVDWDESEVIQNLWLDSDLTREDPAVFDAIRALNEEHPLLYVDWAGRVLAEVGDDESMQAVLDALEAWRRRIAEEHE